MRAPVTAGCWPTGQAEDAADAIGPSSCKHFIDNKPYRLYDDVGDREVVISLRGHLRQMVSLNILSRRNTNRSMSLSLRLPVTTLAIRFDVCGQCRISGYLRHFLRYSQGLK